MQWRIKRRLKLIILAEPNCPENTSSFKQSFSFLYILVCSLLCLHYIHVFRRSRSVFVNYYWTQGWHNTRSRTNSRLPLYYVYVYKTGDDFSFNVKCFIFSWQNVILRLNSLFETLKNWTHIKTLRFREKEPVFNSFLRWLQIFFRFHTLKLFSSVRR